MNSSQSAADEAVGPMVLLAGMLVWERASTMSLLLAATDIFPQDVIDAVTPADMEGDIIELCSHWFAKAKAVDGQEPF